MNYLTVEGDDKRVVACGFESEIVEGHGSNHSEVLAACTFSGRDIDHVVDIVGQETCAIGILKTDVKPHLLSLRGPRHAQTKPDGEGVMPNGKMSNEEGIPPSSEHVQLPVDRLHGVSKQGEFEARAQAAFGERLGICFHLQRLYMPLLCGLGASIRSESH